VAAADLRAPEADVADGAPGEHEAAAAAPFDPEGVRRTFVSEPFSLPSWQRKLARAKAHGHYGPDVEPEPIGPPLPGEPDMRPYRGDADEIGWFRQFGPTHGYSAWEDAFKPGWASSYTKRWKRDGK
jgi:hypothetical protein